MVGVFCALSNQQSAVSYPSLKIDRRLSFDFQILLIDLNSIILQNILIR